MRQIYTSPRAENVERVVALLEQAGIATTQTNRRGWKGGEWKRFSYSSGGNERDAWPQVWVVNSNDQTHARQLLRDVGLEPAIRFADELALSRSGTDIERAREAASKRFKLVILALVAGVIVLIAISQLSR